MPTHRQRQRFRVLWIAVFALVFGAMAPSLNAWVGAADGQTWIEICSPAGPQRVAAGFDSDEAPADGRLGMGMGMDCPYCRLQRDLPAIVHAPGVLVLADGTVVGPLPPPAPTRHFAALVWPAHPSRAPPLAL